jgi:hypothetical protein
LPGLIKVNKSSAVISQQTSLLINPGIKIDMSLTQISHSNFLPHHQSMHLITGTLPLQILQQGASWNLQQETNIDL